MLNKECVMHILQNNTNFPNYMVNPVSMDCIKEALHNKENELVEYNPVNPDNGIYYKLANDKIEKHFGVNQ